MTYRAILVWIAILASCRHPSPRTAKLHMPSLVSHGVPVISSRQWSYALSPNETNDGWNFITFSYNLHSTSPVEVVVVKDVTGTPSAATQQIFETISGLYPNSNYNIANQLRAANGRIFFSDFQNYITYYDPTDASIHQLGPIVETPPTNPHASTIPFTATFDTAGKLYWTTQESENRPSMVFSIDPVTLAIEILGYVGTGQLAYTTYGYSVAADTITASKYVYVAYGKDPWQLWALDISSGIATKLFDAPATGNVQFAQKPEGWTAIIDTDLGKPDNVRTQLWCIDGTTYPYVPGYNPLTLPFTPRSVTPASNLIVNAPGIDATGGIGVVGWRPHGSTGAYTYVNYTVNYKSEIAIESLVTTTDGVLGNAQQYQGFFRYVEPADTHTWFGAYQVVSQGPRLRVGDLVYITGYPNGVLVAYDETKAWQTGVDPAPLGSFAPAGTLSGIKYADFLARSAANNHLYMAGAREREGVGSGIGSYDITSKVFAGTFANLDSTQPAGLAILDGIGRVVFSSRLLNPPGTAQLYIYDQSLNLIAQDSVVAGWTSTGAIFATATSGVIFGILQDGGNVTVYHYDVGNAQLIATASPIAGTLGTLTQRSDGSVWAVVGNSLVRFDIEALTTTVEGDLTSIAPIGKMAFFQNSMFMSSGATLWSLDGLPAPVNNTPPSNLVYSTNPAIYTKDTAIAANTPSSSGGAVVSYAVSPALPTGLALDTGTGIITGTPTAVASIANYRVTATNAFGNTHVDVSITVNALPPSGLTYATNPAIYTKDLAIPANTPSSSGGAVDSYAVSPALPSGLALDTGTGIITGTPTAVASIANYRVTATNAFGNTHVDVSITVNALPPSGLAYSLNPAAYLKGREITPNTPTSSGGSVTLYAVVPDLPAGLILDPSSGVIFGTPTEVTPRADHRVTASNAFGEAHVDVSILVTAGTPYGGFLFPTANPDIVCGLVQGVDDHGHLITNLYRYNLDTADLLQFATAAVPNVVRFVPGSVTSVDGVETSTPASFESIYPGATELVTEFNQQVEIKTIVFPPTAPLFGILISAIQQLDSSVLTRIAGNPLITVNVETLAITIQT